MYNIYSKTNCSTKRHQFLHPEQDSLQRSPERGRREGGFAEGVESLRGAQDNKLVLWEKWFILMKH